MGSFQEVPRKVSVVDYGGSLPVGVFFMLTVVSCTVPVCSFVGPHHHKLMNSREK